MKQPIFKSIRSKSILILTGFLLSLIVMLFLFTGVVIRNALVDLEMENANLQVKRIENAMEFSLDAMNRNIGDWAYWNDTYDYIEGLLPEYVDSNISYDSFANLHLNLVMFIKSDGTVLNHMELDYENETLNTPQPYYVSLMEELGILYNTNPEHFVRNIVSTIDGPMLLVSSPILPTNGIGEVRGNLVFGRLLNQYVVNYISETVEIEFTIKDTSTLLTTNHVVIAFEDKTTYVLHKTIEDQFELHNYMYEVTVPKTVEIIIENTTGVIIGLVITVALIGAVIIIMFIDQNVLKRLLFLHNDLKVIGHETSSMKRLPISNTSDEITFVAKEINTLLDSINRQEKEINVLAYHDYLTGLPNRLRFNEIIHDAILEAKASKEHFAVLFLDLDSFKSVNDTMGHVIGDDLLIEVARRIQTVLTSNCVIARAGGDEFLILSRNTTQDEAQALASDILSVFKEKFQVQKQFIYTSTSIGVAMYPSDGIDAVSLIRNADIAMYYSKDQGKNKYQLCDIDLKNRVRKESQIRSALYDALKNNEFYLHYQPQIDSLDKRILGFEALLRWNNPKLGFVPPNDFIGIAEKLGLIDDIGFYVLRSACRQNQKWFAKYGIQYPISINLSINQFQSGKLRDQIVTVLNETKMDPSKLELEITESLVMKDTELIISMLHSIKKLGVVISIDDFGTGYSSMNHLKEMPIDIIKIAMPFVQDYKNPKTASIIQTIINLSKSLKIETIAEGVETYEQAVFLQRIGCSFMQGYYYYKPMPANQIEEEIFEKHNKIDNH